MKNAIPKSMTVPIVVLGLLATTAPATAQVATALIREGDTIPGQGDVSSIGNPAVNHVGGFSVTLNTAGPTTTLSQIWGNATGGPGAVLFTEGTFDGYEQNAFEAFHGFSDAGNSGYSATSTDVDSGTTGLDGVWVGMTPILVEEQPVPTLPGQFSVFGSRPGMTAAGQPYWVGGFGTTQGGATQNRALFFGFGASPVLMGGDPIVGVPEPVSTASAGIDFNVRYSPSGANYVMESAVVASIESDGVVHVNGIAVTLGGMIVREASPVAAVAGGLPGENWDNFDFFGITDAGVILMTGDTDAVTTQDEFVLLGELIVLREGTVIPAPEGGVSLNGSIEGAYMNAQEDWAVIWDVDEAGGNVEALIFNGALVLREGDAVDLDGDGAVEPGSLLVDFTGISTLVVGDRRPEGIVPIYFTADIDTEGTPSVSDDVEGLFRFDVEVPNHPPVAVCQDVTVTAGITCEANAGVDGGSYDPDGDPITLEQEPPGPYGLGSTEVVLTVTDNKDASDSCSATVTVAPAPLVLEVDPDLLSWGPPVCDVGFDIVRGDLIALSGNEGDFSEATEECLADDHAGLSLDYLESPDAGAGVWFLARRVGDTGSGSYDTGRPSQEGQRDGEIADSGVDCP